MQISIVDMMGQTVLRVQNAKQQKGNYNTLIQTSSLKSGVYLLHIMVNENRITEKIVIAR